MPSSLLGSWIDLEAATAAAADLCPPPLESADPTTRLIETAGGEGASWGTEGEIEAGNPCPPRNLHDRLSTLRERAERNGLVTRPFPVPRLAAVASNPAAASPATAFAVPWGPLPVRVRAFGDWMNESLRPASLFVADDLGQPLVEFQGSGDLLAAASVLATAARRARQHLPGEKDSSVVQLTLAPQQVLTLVTATTSLGPWHAGLCTATALAPSIVGLIARGLRMAADGEGSAPGSPGAVIY